MSDGKASYNNLFNVGYPDIKYLQRTFYKMFHPLVKVPQQVYLQKLMLIMRIFTSHQISYGNLRRFGYAV